MKQTINTACRITYPDKTVLEFTSIEEAAKGTEEYYNSHPTLAKKFRPILSVASIKLRCNKSTPTNNRKAKEFGYYYDLLWKDLDKNV